MVTAREAQQQVKKNIEELKKQQAELERAQIRIDVPQTFLRGEVPLARKIRVQQTFEERARQKEEGLKEISKSLGEQTRYLEEIAPIARRESITESALAKVQKKLSGRKIGSFSSEEERKEFERISSTPEIREALDRAVAIKTGQIKLLLPKSMQQEIKKIEKETGQKIKLKYGEGGTLEPYFEEKAVQTVVPAQTLSPSLSPSITTSSVLVSPSSLQRVRDAFNAPLDRITKFLRPSRKEDIPPKAVKYYNGVPYVKAQTKAVEKNTGLIATEQGLTTQTADLEDRYFITTPEGKVLDVGIYDPSKVSTIPSAGIIGRTVLEGPRGNIPSISSIGREELSKLSKEKLARLPRLVRPDERAKIIMEPSTRLPVDIEEKIGISSLYALAKKPIAIVPAMKIPTPAAMKGTLVYDPVTGKYRPSGYLQAGEREVQFNGATIKIPTEEFPEIPIALKDIVLFPREIGEETAQLVGTSVKYFGEKAGLPGVPFEYIPPEAFVPQKRTLTTFELGEGKFPIQATPPIIVGKGGYPLILGIPTERRQGISKEFLEKRGVVTTELGQEIFIPRDIRLSQGPFPSLATGPPKTLLISPETLGKGAEIGTQIGLYFAPGYGTYLAATDVAIGLEKARTPTKYEKIVPEPRPEGVSDAQYQQYLEDIDKYNLSVDLATSGEKFSGYLQAASGTAILGAKLYSAAKAAKLAKELNQAKPTVTKIIDKRLKNKAVGQFLEKSTGQTIKPTKEMLSGTRVYESSVKVGDKTIKYKFFEIGRAKAEGVPPALGARELYGYQVGKGGKPIGEIFVLSGEVVGKETTDLISRYLIVQKSGTKVGKIAERLGIKSPKLIMGESIERIKSVGGYRPNYFTLMTKTESTVKSLGGRAVKAREAVSFLRAPRSVMVPGFTDIGPTGKIERLFRKGVQVGKGKTLEIQFLAPSKVTGKGIFIYKTKAGPVPGGTRLQIGKSYIFVGKVGKGVRPIIEGEVVGGQVTRQLDVVGRGVASFDPIVERAIAKASSGTKLTRAEADILKAIGAKGTLKQIADYVRRIRARAPVTLVSTTPAVSGSQQTIVRQGAYAGQGLYEFTQGGLVPPRTATGTIQFLTKEAIRNIQIPKPSPLFTIVPGLTRLIPKQSIIPTPKLLVSPLVLEVERIREEQEQTPRTETVFGSFQDLGQEQRPGEAQTLFTPQAQVPRTEITQTQLPRLGTFQALRPSVELIPETTRPPRVPSVFVFPEDDEKKKKKKIKIAPITGVRFIPEVRRKGKFFPVGPATTAERAVRRGATVTRQTLAATFRVRPTGKVPRGFQLPVKPSPQIFRLPKGKEAPFTFVERKTKRLKTSSEVGEIISARRRASSPFFGRRR